MMKSQGVGRRGNIYLALTTGILLGLSYPPIPFGTGAFIAFVPLFFLVRRLRSSAEVFRYSYLTFLVFNLVTVYWISGWNGDDVWLKISGVAVNLVHPLLFCIPVLLLFRIRCRYGELPSILSFPFVWVAYEWAAHLPELSFPWLVLANTQTYNIGSIQFATVTGAFGISFWILVMNTLFYVWLRNLTSGSWKFTSRKSVFCLGAIFLLILLPRLHALLVMKEIGEERDRVRIGIAQPNIDPYDKWKSGETPRMKLSSLLALYDSLSARNTDLVMFPETAIPFRILLYSYAGEEQFLDHHIESVGVPLLTGFPDTRFYDESNAPPSAKRFKDNPLRFDDFNSAMLVLPGRRAEEIYHKIKLTPMSERIPYLDAFPFLADLLTWGVGISNWGIGEDTTVFSLPLRRNVLDTAYLSSLICYETLYPEFVSQFVLRGAELLVIITNDGWFGRTSGPYQLQRYAVLRAIENRRAIARCANNGISCIIDRYGRISQETELYVRTSLVVDVERCRETTYYTRHGDWLAELCTLVTLMLFLGSFFIRRKNNDSVH